MIVVTRVECAQERRRHGVQRNIVGSWLENRLGWRVSSAYRGLLLARPCLLLRRDTKLSLVELGRRRADRSPVRHLHQVLLVKGELLLGRCPGPQASLPRLLAQMLLPYRLVPRMHVEKCRVAL